MCAKYIQGISEITYGEHIVDNTCMQLVMNPYQYDMLLMENLYGGRGLPISARDWSASSALSPMQSFGHECAIFRSCPRIR